MLALEELANQAKSLLCIAVLLLWFYVLHRSFRVALLRERLFAIRAHLFVHFADNRLCFDNQAYGLMRTTLNGLIRWSHRAGWFDMITAVVTMNQGLGRTFAKDYEERWIRGNEELSIETQAVLRRLRGEMHYALAEHLLLTSATCFFSVVLVLGWYCLKCVPGRLAKSFRRFVGDKRVDAMAQRIDAAATVLGRPLMLRTNAVHAA